MWHVQIFAWYETTLATTWGGEINPDVGKWFQPTRHRSSLWRHPGHCCSVPGTGTWQLMATSDVPAKDAYDAQLLGKTTKSAKWLYVAVTVLPKHSRLTSSKPQDSESVTKLCAIDSMRMAFTADDLHVVPFSAGNTVELDLTLPRIINTGSCCHCHPILFIYESRFHVSTCDRCVRVWRRASEWYADINIIEYDRYCGGSVMVWGGICQDGRTDLVVIDGGALTAVRYRNEVLEPVVQPFAGALGQDFVLMYDNARLHTARVVQAYLEQKASMSWSGQHDPQTWIRLNICGTSARDVFQGARTYRRQYRPSQQPRGRRRVERHQPGLCMPSDLEHA